MAQLSALRGREGELREEEGADGQTDRQTGKKFHNKYMGRKGGWPSDGERARARGRSRSVGRSVEGVVGMVRQFSWPVARRRERRGRRKEEIIYEMVASIRPSLPPSLLPWPVRGGGKEQPSGGRLQKRHHHAMPKDGRGRPGMRGQGQPEPSHVMQKGWLDVERGGRRRG